MWRDEGPTSSGTASADQLHAFDHFQYLISALRKRKQHYGQEIPKLDVFLSQCTFAVSLKELTEAEHVRVESPLIRSRPE